MCGKHDEALAQGRAWLALLDPASRARYAGTQTQLETAVAAASGEAGARAMAELQREVDALTAEVSTRRTYRLSTPAEAFLHDTLTQLQQKLAAFAAKEHQAVQQRLA